MRMETSDEESLLIKKIDHLTCALGFEVYDPKPNAKEEKMYSQKEAAWELSVCDRQVRRYVQQGILLETKNHKGPCYTQSAIDDCKMWLIELRKRRA